MKLVEQPAGMQQAQTACIAPLQYAHELSPAGLLSTSVACAGHYKCYAHQDSTQNFHHKAQVN